MTFRTRAATLILATAVWACSGSEEPPPAAALAIDIAPPASVQNRVQFSTAPAVSLRDAAGGRVSQAGVVITASASGTGVTLTGATATTDTAGVAVFPALTAMGLVGPRVLTFSAGTLTPINATVQITAGVPATIVGSWSGPVSPVSLPLRVFPSVAVRDADANPVPGATVTFAVTAGGGSIVNPDQVTSASGTAVGDAWTLGPAAGTNTLSASVTGVANAVTFDATGATVTPGISAGSMSTCAVAPTGYNYCWGNNGFGGLGDGSTSSRSTPVKLTVGPYFKRISAGEQHSCGIAYDGTAFCWGDNSWGQVGDGSTTGRTTPVAVSSASKFIDISAGSVQTCGLTTTGAAMCWGRRFIPSAPISTPTAVSGGLTFQSISIAGSNACAIAVGGAIYCWAVNDPNSTPTVVPGGLTFTQLTTGVRICAISSGTAYCWGGTAGLPPTPTAMTVPGTPVITALGSSADDSNSCLVATTGDAFCLGPNGSGQVGDGTTSPRTSPTAVSGGLSFKAIANGATHTCGLSTTDVVYCWGGTSVGALGDGSLTSSRLTPFQITLPP